MQRPFRGLRLNPDVTCGDQNAAERCKAEQGPVDACADGPRVVKPRDQKQDARHDDCDALKDAKRTWRKAEHVLRIQRIRQQSSTHNKAGGVGDPAGRKRHFTGPLHHVTCLLERLSRTANV